MRCGNCDRLLEEFQCEVGIWWSCIDCDYFIAVYASDWSPGSQLRLGVLRERARRDREDE